MKSYFIQEIYFLPKQQGWQRKHDSQSELGQHVHRTQRCMSPMHSMYFLPGIEVGET